MAHHTSTRWLGAFQVAAGIALGAQAQTEPSTVITITGQAVGSAGVSGFADTPLAKLPMQARIYGSGRIADAGITSIGGLTQLDASLSDAYNAEGYWSILAARGYTLDNRYNYRRDGLPINAETAIALDNKERLELLLGTSGIQAGVSAPGGLVNLVVKRPAGRVRDAQLELRQPGDVRAAVDLGDRYGVDGSIGLRLNAASERLDSTARQTKGERWLVALAADWQLGPDTLLQAEFESSHQSQPSVTGFSMLGDQVPTARSIDPRINLNDQPWRQPVVLDGNTASLRWLQRLAADWRLTVHAMQQRLKSDDRTAFPYGVYDPATYECAQWCDRFAPDGSFTYWQYVSDRERRTSSALQLTLAGKAQAGGLQHALEGGVLVTRFRGRFQDQVFDIAGTGNIEVSLQTAPSPGTPSPNTNRDERSTEFFLRDAVTLAARWQIWAGLRQSRIERSTVLTSPAADGLEPSSYTRSFSAPWLGLSYELMPRTTLYASWGKGLESDLAPNRAQYTNAGRSLSLQSRQYEIGLKHGDERVEAALTWFDIDRGQTADLGSCNGTASCTRVQDGSEHHRGIEAEGTLQAKRWTWTAGAMALAAERRGSADPAVNGQRPVNVPALSLRLGSEYRPAAVPGLALLAHLTAESDRVVLPSDTRVRIPGWSRIDLGARWRQMLGDMTLVWRVGVDNAADRRAWKESPYQFSHVYLYPLQPRTWRASVQVAY